MDISPISIEGLEGVSGPESVSSGRASLSPLQRDFALHFVATGGKARRAAILAGYGAPSAHISAHRNLVNPKVLAEIKRLSLVNIQSALPVAIRTLIDICLHSKDDKARAMAANSLLDRGGMAAPKGGVQVNVGVQVNGGQVQALIGEIWNAKQARVSGIGGGMPDSSQLLEAAPEPIGLEPPAAPPPGGGELPGSHRGSSSVPPHPNAQHQSPTGPGDMFD